MKCVASGGDSPLCKQLLSFCPSQETEKSLSQTQSIDSDGELTDKLLALKQSQSQEETIELPSFPPVTCDDDTGTSMSHICR